MPSDTGTVDFSGVPHPQIKRIWRRWHARFVAAGVDVNIIDGLRREIADWSQWCDRWMDVGDDLYRFAQQAFQRGSELTAGQSWFRAALLYHFGGMFYVSDMQRFERSHNKKLDAFQRAALLLQPPAMRVEVAFDGAKMPMLVRNPRQDGPAPVAMLFNGFEGVKEESEGRVAELHARGLATVSWDGPGRGETWAQLPMTGAYGPATSAVIDALEAVDGIDASRVGVLGPNRGGFLALKAAAHDERIKACAVTSPGFDRRGTKWDDPYQVAFDMHLFHARSEAELRERLDQPDLTLEADVDRIKCPVSIIAGGRDAGTQFRGSRRLYEELSGAKEWVVVEDAERNGNNVPYKVRPLMADFLAKHIGGVRATRQRRRGVGIGR